MAEDPGGGIFRLEITAHKERDLGTGQVVSLHDGKAGEMEILNRARVGPVFDDIASVHGATAPGAVLALKQDVRVQEARRSRIECVGEIGGPGG